MCDNIGEIMQIPRELSEKINLLYGEIKNNKIKDIQKNLTDKYKNKTGESKSLIDDKNDRIYIQSMQMTSIRVGLFKSISKILLKNGMFIFTASNIEYQRRIPYKVQF